VFTAHNRGAPDTAVDRELDGPSASSETALFQTQNIPQMVSEWGSVREAVGGFPPCWSQLRVSNGGDRQVLDLPRDALLAAGVDARHLLRVGFTGIRSNRCWPDQGAGFIKIA
jgi:hypothetical protein